MTDDWLRKSTRPVRIARVDATAPSVARVWNYLGGGRDNFEADRAAARELIAAAPVMADVAQASRAFLRRVVTFLAAEAGIRQFLDIGTGIPAAGSTHELAQALDPASRIVYVDNDPVALAYARALTLSRHEGAISCLEADAREPVAIIDAARRTLNPRQPVAILMIGVLNFIEGPGLVARVLGELTAALGPGSYLAVLQPAVHEGLIAAHMICGERGVHPMDYANQPRATYTRPEIASVGLTEAQCAERGLPVKVGKVPFQAIAKAVIHGSREGFAKVIAHAETGAILGVHATKERPVVENGQIVIRPMNYLALSYDHRIIDGREAVLSLVAMKEALEDPARLLLDI